MEQKRKPGRPKKQTTYEIVVQSNDPQKVERVQNISSQLGLGLSLSDKFTIDDTNIKIHNNVIFGVLKINNIDIKLIGTSSEIYLRAIDICNLFKIKNHNKACAKLNKFSNTKQILSDIINELNWDYPYFDKYDRSSIFLTRFGVNYLIFRGNTEELIDLQQYIYKTVLPALANYGFYVERRILESRIVELEQKFALNTSQGYLIFPRKYDKSTLEKMGLRFDYVIKKWVITSDHPKYEEYMVMWGVNSCRKKYIDRIIDGYYPPIVHACTIKWNWLMFETETRKFFYYDEYGIGVDEVEMVIKYINNLRPEPANM